jgi:hypothetical protein
MLSAKAGNQTIVLLVFPEIQSAVYVVLIEYIEDSQLGKT